MTRGEGRHSTHAGVAGGDRASGNPDIRYRTDDDTEPTIAPSDPDERDTAPRYATQVMEPIIVPKAHVNPEERPFARGAVKQHLDSGAPDRTRPRRRRRQVRTSRIVLVVVIVLVAALIAGFLYWRNLQGEEARYDAAKSDLDAAVALVQGSDEEIVGIDDAVNEEATVDRIDELQALIDAAPATEEDLDQALELLQGIESTMQRHEDGAIVSNLEDSIDARIDMLDIGPKLIGYDIEALKAATDLTDAWTLIVSADSRSREAISLVADATTDNVTQASAINDEVIGSLNTARGKITDAQTQFPEADFSAILTYIDAKLAAVGYAKASDEALLAGDTDAAAAQTDLYNTADAAVVTAATALPSDPSTIILSAYDTATSDLRSDYTAARDKAASADAEVRNYLGIGEAISDSTEEEGQDSQTTA